MNPIDFQETVMEATKYYPYLGVRDGMSTGESSQASRGRIGLDREVFFHEYEERFVKTTR